MDSIEDVKWINGSHKEDNRIFDSEFEAEEWADSIYPDFVAFLSETTNVGYATPDEKVIKYLVTLFPQWAEYSNLQSGVGTGKAEINDQIFYFGTVHQTMKCCQTTNWECYTLIT